jgi:hypothetical protein
MTMSGSRRIDTLLLLIPLVAINAILFSGAYIVMEPGMAALLRVVPEGLLPDYRPSTCLPKLFNEGIAFGLMYGQVALLILWAGTSRVVLYLRVPIAAAGLSLLILVLGHPDFDLAAWDGYSLVFYEFATEALLVCSCLFAVHRRGWRLAHISDVEFATAMSQSPIRYSLRTLCIAVTAAGLVMGMVPHWNHWWVVAAMAQSMWFVCAVGILAGVMSLVAVWTVLGVAPWLRNPILFELPMLCAGGAVLGALLPTFWEWPPSVAWIYGLFGLGRAAMLGSGLCIARSVGFRWVRFSAEEVQSPTVAPLRLTDSLASLSRAL